MNYASALLILALLLTVGSNGNAQPQPDRTEDGSTELTLSVRNNPVRVGEALTLYITMKNMHNDKYCHKVIGETGRADLNGYKVEVSDFDGNNYPMLKQKRLRAWSVFNECLEHGKATLEQMDVVRLVDLSRPGKYQMRVSHLDNVTNETVWSNRITVTITQ
jgi:hypothetical protein